MSRYARDECEFYRDLVIACYHERYADTPTIEALRDLRKRRGEYV